MRYDDLCEFYESPLGLAAAELLQARMGELWGFLGDKNKSKGEGRILLHVGYSVPYVNLFSPVCERVLSVMPPEINPKGKGGEGGERGEGCVAEMESLPFGNMSMDNVVVVHGLEFAEDIEEAVAELSRVLVVGGRLLLVTPMSWRWGGWGGLKGTPFGCGKRFGYLSLRRLLGRHLLDIVGYRSAFHLPPRLDRFVKGWGGLRYIPIGGVVVLDCRKAVAGSGNRVRVRERVLVPKAKPRYA